MKVILVGFMGSGKTSFGKKLASKMNLKFIDSDYEIESMAGKSISKIFEDEGENEFRNLENTFLKDLSNSKDNFVLSTGGGMPCFNNNMSLLNELGTTIYLEMSPKALLKRLENGLDHRPLLAGMKENELLQHIEDQLNVRDKFYQQATITIPGLSINQEIISKLIEKIENYEA